MTRALIWLLLLSTCATNEGVARRLALAQSDMLINRIDRVIDAHDLAAIERALK